MTPPADPRAIATEALYLTAYEGATGTWEHDDGDVRITHPDGSQTIFYPADLAPLIAHAGTHYATLAHALLAALGEREAMLADLPHALDACDCPSPGAWARECREPYPKEHYDAIDRVRNAANARPALAALAGMCVLPVEVVRHLTGACGCRRQWMGGIREGSWPPKHTDAIAAAEAELRAIAEVL